MTTTIERLTRPTAEDIEGLADVLADVVEGGASVSFMLPFARDEALAFWRKVAAQTIAGDRALLVARDGARRIVGTVQLVLAQPPNQPHRADLSKLLVHRRAQRQGVAEALMRAIEPVALKEGKWLLVLDTASDVAERLYTRCGWTRVGAIPDFALLPGGGLCNTVLYFKKLKTVPGPTG